MGRITTEPYQPLVHLGSEWGRWVVPDDLIDPSWICYCVGAGSDISFDLALIERYGAQVRCVDPLATFREQAEAQANGDPRFSFHEAALAARDGPLLMYGAVDLESGSLSAANLYRTRRTITMRGRTLASLMADAGDLRIDLLKLDIEGSEYEVLPNIDLAAVGVRVLCVELHASRPVADARRTIELISSQGYSLIHLQDPAGYTFLRRLQR